MDKSKVEFHCHTSNSFDCNVSLDRRITDYAKLGFSHLVITDHDEVLKKSDFELINGNHEELNIIPGIEVSTYVGHIILLNCTKRPLFSSLAFLVFWSKVYGAQIYIPHPCRPGTGLLHEHLRLSISTCYIKWFLGFATFLEVANPRDKITEKSKIHFSIYEELMKLTFTVASDSHFVDDVNISGCPLSGLIWTTPEVQEFFNDHIEVTENKVVASLTIWMRYFKRSIGYILRYF